MAERQDDCWSRAWRYESTCGLTCTCSVLVAGALCYGILRDWGFGGLRLGQHVSVCCKTCCWTLTILRHSDVWVSAGGQRACHVQEEYMTAGHRSRCCMGTVEWRSENGRQETARRWKARGVGVCLSQVGRGAVTVAQGVGSKSGAAQAGVGIVLLLPLAPMSIYCHIPSAFVEVHAQGFLYFPFFSPLSAIRWQRSYWTTPCWAAACCPPYGRPCTARASVSGAATCRRPTRPGSHRC